MTNPQKSATIAGGIVGLVLLASGGLWAEQTLTQTQPARTQPVQTQPAQAQPAQTQAAQTQSTQARPVVASNREVVKKPAQARHRKVVARAKPGPALPAFPEYVPEPYPAPVAYTLPPPLPVYQQPVIVATPSIMVGYGYGYGYGYDYRGYSMSRGGYYGWPARGSYGGQYSPRSFSGGPEHMAARGFRR